MQPLQLNVTTRASIIAMQVGSNMKNTQRAVRLILSFLIINFATASKGFSESQSFRYFANKSIIALYAKARNLNGAFAKICAPADWNSKSIEGLGLKTMVVVEENPVQAFWRVYGGVCDIAVIKQQSLTKKDIEFLSGRKEFELVLDK